MTILFSIVVVQAQPQVRKSSTPADRAKAVEIARSLERDPLSKQAKEQRNWVVHWLIDVPDINVKLCGNLLSPLLDSKKNYSAELFAQMIPSSAAFIIENPDRAKDDRVVHTAALEGVLRTYESILRAKPAAKWAFLDALLTKRDNGQLAEYVASSCK